MNLLSTAAAGSRGDASTACRPPQPTLAPAIRATIIARSPALAALFFSLALSLLSPLPALAHGFVGKRFFPATVVTEDPFVAEELSLPTIASFRSPGSGDEPATRATTFSADVSKRITDNLGFSLGTSYVELAPSGGDKQHGFDNAAVGPWVARRLVRGRVDRGGVARTTQRRAHAGLGVLSAAAPRSLRPAPRRVAEALARGRARARSNERTAIGERALARRDSIGGGASNRRMGAIIADCSAAGNIV